MQTEYELWAVNNNEKADNAQIFITDYLTEADHRPFYGMNVGSVFRSMF